jgi:hypothetical protein
MKFCNASFKKTLSGRPLWPEFRVKRRKTALFSGFCKPEISFFRMLEAGKFSSSSFLRTGMQFFPAFLGGKTK